jgi:hypothetical protein
MGDSEDLFFKQVEYFDNHFIFAINSYSIYKRSVQVPRGYTYFRCRCSPVYLFPLLSQLPTEIDELRVLRLFIFL